MGKKSNISGGNKHKKYAKEKEQDIKLNLYDLDKTPDQEFAFVMRMLGNKRCELKCYDNKIRIGLIRSSKRQMSKRKNWITSNSTVLIAKRTFTTIDDKCDIIKLYNSEELAFLVSHKKIHNNFIKSGSLQSDIDTITEIFSFDHDAPINIKKNDRNYENIYVFSSEEEEEGEQPEDGTHYNKYNKSTKLTKNINIDHI